VVAARSRRYPLITDPVPWEPLLAPLPLSALSRAGGDERFIVRGYRLLAGGNPASRVEPLGSFSTLLLCEGSMQAACVRCGATARAAQADLPTLCTATRLPDDGACGVPLLGGRRQPRRGG
jgi:hypothetical protein